MATVVNNPATPTNNDSGGGMGFLLGVILIIIFAIIFIFYGIPYVSNSIGNNTQSSTPQINVPDQVDVNVNKGQ